MLSNKNEASDYFKICIANQNAETLQRHAKIIENLCEFWLRSYFKNVRKYWKKDQLLLDKNGNCYQLILVLEAELDANPDSQITEVLSNLNRLYSSNVTYVPVRIFIGKRPVHSFRNLQTFKLPYNQSVLNTEKKYAKI